MGTNETSERKDLPVNTEPGQGRPFWLIGLALLGLVAFLLVGAFLMDRQLRPRVGINAPQVAATAASATDVPAAIIPPTVQSTVAPTPTVVAVAPNATEGPGGLRVATSPLELEIEAAYLHYWDVLAQAYLDTDSSHLAEVMSDPELSRQTQEISNLKSQGKAAKLIVEHRIAFAKVSPDSAVVYDEYLNRSVFIDPATKQERPTTAQPATEKISFEMTKIDGSWKVVDATRHD